ncbi:transglutaminase-like domain-containing protein [Streptomyces sp.]|uniref:transglutaminase-like domain-containing protein n=1 Tax=Streptomyces sp. TaxID=1931 RepID=UPI002F948F5E
MSEAPPRPPAPERRAVSAAELRRHWLPAVDRLPAVPAAHRRPDVGVRGAARILGIDEATVRLLVAAGLPATEAGGLGAWPRDGGDAGACADDCVWRAGTGSGTDDRTRHGSSGGDVETRTHHDPPDHHGANAGALDRHTPYAASPDGPLMDRYDLINLGLLAGTGRSGPEAAEWRWAGQAGGEPGGWIAPRALRLALSTDCSVRCAGPAPAAPPVTSIASGTTTVRRWRTLEPGGRVLVDVTLRGRSRRVRSRDAREVFDELHAGLAGGRYRYARLPAALAADPEQALAAGVVDAVTAALVMAAQARAAGLEARIRSGFLLGPGDTSRRSAALRHTWAEIREAGHWLPLDPVQAYRAARHPAAHPDFTDFCRGSRPNWLLPWAYGTHAAPAPHLCPDGGRAVTSCRQLPPQHGDF